MPTSKVPNAGTTPNRDSTLPPAAHGDLANAERPTAHPFHVFCFLSASGGQGKTTSAEACVLAAMIAGRAVRILSADNQKRLERKFGAIVRSIALPTRKALDDDDMALLRAFGPLFEAIRASKSDHADVVVDTAATWHSSVLSMAAEAHLDDRITKAGGVLSFCVIATAQPDAMGQLIETSEIAATHLPAARLVWVLNERFGPIDPARFDWTQVDIEPARAAAMRKRAISVRIPRLQDTVWQPLDQAGFDMRKALLASPETLAPLWETPRGPIDATAAEVVQGRLGDWVSAIIGAFQRLIENAA